MSSGTYLKASDGHKLGVTDRFTLGKGGRWFYDFNTHAIHSWVKFNQEIIDHVLI